MKTKMLLFAAVGLMVVSSAGLGSPLDRAQVPAGTKWVFHADYQAFSASRIGQLVRQEIALHHQKGIDALKQLLGTDLLNDIEGLTVFGPDGDEANAVALVRGKFDREKLLALLALNPEYSQSAHNDITLHHWDNVERQWNSEQGATITISAKPQVGAFAADNLIVISQTAGAVKGALDVLAGHAPSLAASPNALQQMLINGAEGAFLTAAAVDVSELTGQNDHAAVLKNSRVLMVLADEYEGRTGLWVKLEANSVEAAMQIEQVARGMLAFASLQMQYSPEISAILKGVGLTRTEASLALSFQYPSEELFALLKSFAPQVVPSL